MPLNFIVHEDGVKQKENQKLIEYEKYHIDVVIENEGQKNVLQTMKNEEHLVSLVVDCAAHLIETRSIRLFRVQTKVENERVEKS